MKKINQKGIAHIQLIAIAVLVVGLLGFAGWRVWQSRQMSASAANFTKIGTHYYNGAVYEVKACRKRGLIKTGFGNFDQVSLRLDIVSGNRNYVDWKIQTSNGTTVQDSRSTRTDGTYNQTIVYYNFGNGVIQGNYRIYSSLSGTARLDLSAQNITCWY